MENRKYGVVYTPDSLASFVADLLSNYMQQDSSIKLKNILDPACGEGALLKAFKEICKEKTVFVGIDIDKNATENISDEFQVFEKDSILPDSSTTTIKYWRKNLPKLQAIIANPPWSSEKIYGREDLKRAGFNLIEGQYDSYVLFIELAYNLLEENGFFAFIIPDSLFDAQNELLRKFLLEKTQIKVIARLGEKFFENVNRATTVIVCQKKQPDDNSKTECFRLSTENRREYLEGKKSLMYFYMKGSHSVLQKRFLMNESFNFDVDTREEEEQLLEKIRKDAIEWDRIFMFGRGVEISKSGEITVCMKCGCAQGYTKKQLLDGKKSCTSCGEETLINHKTTQVMVCEGATNGFSKMIAGEDLHRYKCSTNHYVKLNVTGINYKVDSLYTSPKLLVRKTGLGIYAAIDYNHELTSQTVYILKYLKDGDNVPLEYYLALLNSRVVYYYYLKMYGENEWKSHPYLTKKIIFSLPIREYEGSKLDKEIIELATRVSHDYSYDLDVKLEELIMKKYELSQLDRLFISKEMNNLPDLSSVNNMKFEVIT